MADEDRWSREGRHGVPNTIPEMWIYLESEHRATHEWRQQQRDATNAIQSRLTQIETEMRGHYVTRELYEADKKAMQETIAPLKRAYYGVVVAICGMFLAALGGLVWKGVGP